MLTKRMLFAVTTFTSYASSGFNAFRPNRRVAASFCSGGYADRAPDLRAPELGVPLPTHGPRP